MKARRERHGRVELDDRLTQSKTGRIVEEVETQVETAEACRCQHIPDEERQEANYQER